MDQTLFEVGEILFNITGIDFSWYRVRFLSGEDWAFPDTHIHPIPLYPVLFP